jgi:iron complex transport system substrate-binding protein
MRILIFVWSFLRNSFLLLAFFSPVFAENITIVDDRGVSVTFEQAPKRIVSLLPSLTETVCELDQCHRLVGVDRYSDFPKMVQRLPQVGGGLDPSVEAIVALRPDVVLMGTSTRAADHLRTLGLKVVALEPKTHADVERVIIKIGQLLEVSDPQKVWHSIDAGVSSAVRSLPPSVRGTRVYFEVDPGPYAAGEASFIGETLKRLGVKNIVNAELGAFPKLNPEFVVRANPDLIMVGQRSAVGMIQRPGWSRINAIRNKKICVFPADQSNVLVRPGPRMAEAAHIMANCLSTHTSTTGLLKP